MYDGCQNDRVSDFEEYLNQKIDSIERSETDLLFKKILCVSIFDSISSCVYPSLKNKCRFIRLIHDFSRWEDRDKICVLHLLRFCSLFPDPKLAKIRDFSRDCFKSWTIIKDTDSNDSTVCISKNPKEEELSAMWSGIKSETGLPYKLIDFRADHLLYQLRNELVHNFQCRGYEFKSSHFTHEKPYYKFYNNHDFSGGKFELTFPVEFLINLCKETLNNVISYFRKNNINPFITYFSGDFLLEKLN